MTLPTDPPTPPAPAPAPPAPAPAPVPGPPPQPAPAPTPAPQPQPQPQPGTTGKVVADGDVYDYPEHTPLASMTPNQQSEYWRHRARKHEDRNKAMSDYDALKETAAKYTQLVTASQTEQERAVAEATRQGHASALKEFGGQLVEQWFRVHTAGRLPEESVNALLSGLDRSQFVNAEGVVDTAKVQTFVNSIVPTASAPAPGAPGTPPAADPGTGQPPVPPAPQPTVPPRGPDLGQGTPLNAPKSGLEAGRELARARFSKTTTAP